MSYPSCFCFLFLGSFSLLNKEQKYYYAFEEKIPLYTVENHYVLRYDTIPAKEPESLKLKGMSPEISLFWKDEKTAIVDLTNKGASVDIIDYLKGFENLYSIQPLFKLKEGLEMPVTDELVIGFSQIKEEEIRDLHKLLEVTILETNSVFQHLRVPRGADALKIANQYQKADWWNLRIRISSYLQSLFRVYLMNLTLITSFIFAILVRFLIL